MTKVETMHALLSKTPGKVVTYSDLSKALKQPMNSVHQTLFQLRKQNPNLHVTVKPKVGLVLESAAKASIPKVVSVGKESTNVPLDFGVVAFMTGNTITLRSGSAVITLTRKAMANLFAFAETQKVTVELPFLVPNGVDPTRGDYP